MSAENIENAADNVYICGIANSGKTTLFNGLTGGNERVGNWYGVTTSIKKGKFMCREKSVNVYDLPGSYFDDYTLEGKRSLKKIKEGEAVLILTCEAACLKEGLRLFKKVKKYSRGRIALVINMYSELKKRGGYIKSDELKKLIDCDVIIAEVNEKKDVEAVKVLIYELLREKNEATQSKNNCDFTEIQSDDYDEEFVCERVFKRPSGAFCGLDRKLFGYPILYSLLFVAAFFACAYIAFGNYGIGRFLSDLTQKILYFCLENPVRALLKKFAVSEFLIGFVCDGVINSVCSLITFLPPLLILQILIFFAEQSGILARVAFLFDEFFSLIGLNGRVVFTFLTGYGCTAAAAFCAEGLECENAKNRAVLCLPFIPCSAKTPVVLYLLSAVGGGYSFLIFILFNVFGLLFAAFFAYINKTLKKQNSGELIIEFPPIRIPKAKNMFKHLQNFAKSFIIKIGTIVFIVSMSFWLLGSITPSFKMASGIESSVLSVIGKSFSFIFAPIGISDWRFSLAAFAGLFAKESAVSVLLACGASEIGIASALSYLVFFALYSPCFAALFAIKKVCGTKYALHCFVFQNLCAYAVCCVVYCFFTHLKICVVVLFLAAFVIFFALRLIKINSRRFRRRKIG